MAEETKNFLSCQETPLRFPDSLSLEDLKTCKKCAVALSTPVAGMCNLTDAGDGFVVGENIQSQLRYNGLSYSLNEARFVYPAAHRLPGQPELVAELHCYFQADSAANRSSTYCLVLPLMTGKGVGNAYFSLLGQLASKRPTLQTLFTPTAPLLQYVGADLRGRTKTDPTPRNMCAPVGKKINFLVSTGAAYILPADLSRLVSRLTVSDVYKKGSGPPANGKALDVGRTQSLVVVVPKLTIKGSTATATTTGPNTGANASTVATSALQCRRLDVGKDVKDGKVYVGGGKRPGDTTLDKELKAAADPTKNLDGVRGKASIQPGDIETILAIVFGLLMAVILVGFLASGVLKKLPNYIPALKVYFADPTRSTLGAVKDAFEATTTTTTR
jgi:hypothetical protein